MDKTIFTNNEQELQMIYKEEVQKLQENEGKLIVLAKLTLDDFPRDLPEISKKNIEKALLAIKIKDYISLENGQKLLGLDDFAVNKISLSYSEKKLIQDRFTHLIELENKRNAQELAPSDKLLKEEEKLINLLRENSALSESLAELKLKELELMKEVSEALVSSAQKNQVQGILDEAKIAQLQINTMNQLIKESEMSRTLHSKKAFTEMSERIDQLLQEKIRGSNK